MRRRLRFSLLCCGCVLFTVAVWYDGGQVSSTSVIIPASDLTHDSQAPSSVGVRGKETNMALMRDENSVINEHSAGFLSVHKPLRKHPSNRKPATAIEQKLAENIMQRSRKLEKRDGVDNLDPWEAEQARRKAVIAHACEGWQRDGWKYKPKSRDELQHLLVDDTHKAIYCFIPKVGCTNWKRLWMILTGLTNQTDPLKIQDSLPHNLHHAMMLVNQRHKDPILEAKVHAYKKFLVVRDPYERLLSAFRDKLERPGNEFYQRNVVDRIKKMRFWETRDKNVTFSNFVSFVTTLHRGEFDEHWRPYALTCFPCAIQYDVIGKYETIVEDSERFLRLIGAPKDLHFPPFVPGTTSRLLPRYLASLSSRQFGRIYHIYEDDLKMFGYKAWSPDDPRLSL